jgi:hypothetical protein
MERRWRYWVGDAFAGKLSSRDDREVRVVDAGFACRESRAGEGGSRRFARGVSADASGKLDFRDAARGNSGMPGGRNAGAGAD